MVFGVMLFLLFGMLCILAGPVFWTRSIARRAGDTIPQAGQIVPVPGGAIHYVDLGPKDAPPVLMIHGLAGQLQHFTYGVADQLSDEARLIIVDRPGCGYSQRDGEAQADLIEQGRMIMALLDHLNIDRVTIAGHSLGGAVALGMALEFPERVSGLALIAPLTHPSTPAAIFRGLVIENQLQRQIIAQTLAVPVAQMTSAKVLVDAFHPEPVAPNFMTRAGAILGLRPKSFVAASQDIIASTGARQMAARYPELITPGIVLYGEKDAILSAKAQGVPMAQYGITYRELPERGHMLPMTAVGDCAQLIRDVIAMGKS